MRWDSMRLRSAPTVMASPLMTVSAIVTRGARARRRATTPASSSPGLRPSGSAASAEICTLQASLPGSALAVIGPSFSIMFLATGNFIGRDASRKRWGGMATVSVGRVGGS